MLSPQPRESHEAPRGPHNNDLVDGSTNPRPLWYDAWYEAEEELREVLAGKETSTTPLVPAWLPAFERRSWSQSSTSAGSSPYMKDICTSPHHGRTSPSPSLSLECASPKPAASEIYQDNGLELESPSLSLSQLLKSPGSGYAGDRSAWSQSRKVFFGGIPQDLDQNDLYQLASKFGTVKKAWLQLVQGQSPATQKHRGFGFVIFSEGRAVELLLGEEVSKFIQIGDGQKLEVKRAVSRTDTSLAKEQGTVRSLKEARLNRKLATPDLSTGSGQDQSRRIALGDRTNLPQLPAFPPMLSSGANGANVAGGSVPPQATSPCRSYVAEPSDPRAVSACPSPSPSDSFLSIFAGPKPCNKELERMLLQALPDHYDD